MGKGKGMGKGGVMMMRKGVRREVVMEGRGGEGDGYGWS